jgi:hypothetical protein
MTTSARIAAVLGARRLPAGCLAEPLGLSQQAVSRRMREQTDWTVTELVVVARFLGVDAAELLPEVPAAA